MSNVLWDILHTARKDRYVEIMCCDDPMTPGIDSEGELEVFTCWWCSKRMHPDKLFYDKIRAYYGPRS